MKMRLKELRKSKNLTQKQVAKVLGISVQTYAAYEKSIKEPDDATLFFLSGIFDVTIDELFYDEPNPQASIKNFANTPRERELLRLYRKLNNQEQVNVMSFILGMVSAKESYARLSSNDKPKTE